MGGGNNSFFTSFVLILLVLLPCKSWAEIIYDNETGLEYNTETQAITGIGSFTGTFLLIPYVITDKYDTNYYVQSIAENAFAGANITTVAFKEFSLKIEKGAFKGSKLKSVSLTGQVKSIGDEAFADCSDLKEFIIGDNWLLFNNYNSTIFGDKNKLNKDFKIFVSSDLINTYKSNWPDFADYIVVDHASMLNHETNYSEGGITITGFKNSGSNLTEDLVIPTSINGQIVTSIGLGAFMNDHNFEGSGLEGLKSVVIPATVKTISQDAFNTCRHLTSVTFAEGSQLATISQRAFTQCYKLTNINLPASVKTIGERAFYLTPLTSINLPASLQTIGSGAFARTKLKNVNIPTSVQSIGEGTQAIGVFDNCQDLTIVRLLGTISTINANTFNNMPSLMGIIINKDAYSYYTSQSFVNNDKLIDDVAESVMTLTDEGFQYSSNAVYFPANMLTYSRTMQTPGEYATLCLPFNFKLSDANGAFETAYTLKNQIIHFVPTETGKNDNNWDEKFILMLKEVSQDTSIPANTPLFVKMAADKQSFSLTNTADMVLYASKTITPTAMEIVDWDGTSGLMKENINYEISYGSSYKPVDASEQTNLYTFNTDGTFGPQTAGTYKPFRLGLTVIDKTASAGGSQAKALNITIGMADSSTTGIREIIPSSQDKASLISKASVRGIVFDLSGRKVATEAQKNSLSKGVYILNGKKFVTK